MYSFIKLLHILSAIISVGVTISYLVWLMKAGNNKINILFALKGIKFLDDKVANPAYIITLLSGLLMTYISGYNILLTSWILLSLILFSVMGIIGFGFYSPALSRQIRILEEYGSDSGLYRGANIKQTSIGIGLIVLAILIVAIMVIKPSWIFLNFNY